MRRGQRRFLPVGFRDIAAAAPLGKTPSSGVPLAAAGNAVLSVCARQAVLHRCDTAFSFLSSKCKFSAKNVQKSPPPRICVKKCNPFDHKGMLTIRAILLGWLSQYNGIVNNCVWPFAVRRPETSKARAAYCKQRESMNKIFRVIYNRATQSWVAVSELTKAHKKTKLIERQKKYVRLFGEPY